MLKLVPQLKTNKLFKLLLVDMKVNGNILMRLEMAVIAKQAKMPYFHCCLSS